MLGLRHKLSLGFGGLLIILALIGTQGIIHLSHLGEAIDVILRENYRSVIACQDMKEALERMDSGVLFILLGYTEAGRLLIRTNEANFERALHIELNNVTVLGEGERAKRLGEFFTEYKTRLRRMDDPGRNYFDQRQAYFSRLLPLFQQIKNTAGDILQLNQRNMSEANDLARQRAAAARRQMYIFLLFGILLAVGFIILIRYWILQPINRLIRSADEIRKGNLDLVVKTGSRDEIGHLSESFNAMAASLRELRRNDQATLTRIRRATQETFSTLSNVVAVVDLDGRVEVASETAKSAFGLRPASLLKQLPFVWMNDLFQHALTEGHPVRKQKEPKFIQHFINGEEHFFRPEAVPILGRDRQPTGVLLVVQDVSQIVQQDEMKKGLVATVSHQLKTPLTAIRMAIHLLLEEKAGTLNEKQAELLLAAREESDRLHAILENLLDMSRIESGRVPLAIHSVNPESLALAAIDPFRVAAQDQGVALRFEFPGDLPDVLADQARIKHVFSNLLSNALTYTSAGGTVTLAARAGEKEVRFFVRDTGRGIPREYLPRIFEPFFQVPDQENASGAGLGLAIVRDIVIAHGGEVSVESQPGEGSTFIFTLKRADMAVAEAAKL